jgi:hypothetical protein
MIYLRTNLETAESVMSDSEFSLAFDIEINLILTVCFWNLWSMHTKTNLVFTTLFSNLHILKGNDSLILNNFYNKK